MDAAQLVRFHQTGEKPGGDGVSDLRPALLARYADLADLRYDFPLVLVDGHRGQAAETLSGLMNGILREIASSGSGGERLRQHVLRLEARIRRLVAGGARETLSDLWARAAGELVEEADDPDPLQDSLERARAALTADGPVVDCDDEFPLAFVGHAWVSVEEQRAVQARREIDELVLGLEGVLRADFLRSAAGRAPDRLQASVGTADEASFDFRAWSEILATRPGDGALPEARRGRIERVLAVLRSQRFFAPPGDPGHEVLSFQFESCLAAVGAFHERADQLVDLVKAITVGRLELDNRYREPVHDPVFESFDLTTIGREDLASFPSYLVVLRLDDLPREERAAVLDVLSSDLPFKVLVQTSDLLGRPPLGDLDLAAGMRGSQLAGVAVGLGSAYVVQAAASNLYQMTDRVRGGMAHPGPALFSVYTGSVGTESLLPAYLRAAAATQSRAFPSFAFDPGAGADWAARFTVEGNPQVDEDWPVDDFDYEDDALQRIAERVAFTFVDFAATDDRFTAHLQPVPREAWSDAMVPAAEYLDFENGAGRGKMPYVLMVDADNRLTRVVVDRRVIRAARSCAAAWRNLQELGGIHNSHARRLLESEKARWEAEAEERLAAAPPAASAVGVAEPATAAPAAAADAEPATAEGVVQEARPVDEPYIETARCTTCDECTKLNSRMFAYDENKQAYIADLQAGTFREMVEAAESCQVAIIHPGKPWDTTEPGLDDLIRRAASFN